tara:strand:+ start:166 stop:540 length:375 start_codon:yes stop_codon:yes gene_type:complete
MSHFAKIKNGVVQTVIVAEQDTIDNMVAESGVTWVQTSYNTRGGVHYAPNSNTPDGGVALRKNYAGVGYTYDSTKDAFIAPQPHSSWILDETTCSWNAPIAMPDDGKEYVWNESKLAWEEVTFE